MDNLESLQNKNKTPDPEPTIAEKRRRFIERYHVVMVNEGMGYRIDLETKSLYIVIPPGQDFSAVKKVRLLKDGLRKIAVVLMNHKDITRVQGTSWIVKQRPELVEKFGFSIESVEEPLSFEDKIDAKIDKLTDTSEKDPDINEGERSMAWITRERFLGKYLDPSDL